MRVYLQPPRPNGRGGSRAARSERGEKEESVLADV